jgi:cell division protein FtsW
MQRHAIHLLIISVAGLCALGLIMLFSTGAFARDSHGDMNFFVKKQAFWLAVGIGAITLAAIVDYHFWVRYWWALFALSAVLLILCFIPPIGMRINGSSRWVNLGLTTFQPSELAKVASILFLAWWFSQKGADFNSLMDGFVKPLSVLLILMTLIILEVDIGNTALIGGTAVCVLFLAGASMRWLTVLAACGFSAIIAAGLSVSERKGRLMAFLDPEEYKLGEGLQQWQALIAFGSGGLHGLGLGESRQKMLYLPYAHTDFIFPMIGEELGLVATSATVFAFLLIFLSGVLVASNASDRQGMVLGFGAVSMITLQAVVNIGVTTSLLPNKGMPLPFISYGGSNLIVCLFMIGLLVNIHRQGRPIHQTLDPTLLRPHFEPRV